MALFPVGKVEVTPGAAAALAAAGASSNDYLARHERGDWGDDAEDRQHADFALRYGHQITSNYTLPNGATMFVITAVDRSATQLLLADEYMVQEVDLRQGYGIWANSYDNEKNPLIAIEQPHVDTLL